MKDVLVCVCVCVCVLGWNTGGGIGQGIQVMLIQLIYLISAQTRALFTSDMSFLKVCMWEKRRYGNGGFREWFGPCKIEWELYKL